MKYNILALTAIIVAQLILFLTFAVVSVSSSVGAGLIVTTLACFPCSWGLFKILDKLSDMKVAREYFRS